MKIKASNGLSADTDVDRAWRDRARDKQLAKRRDASVEVTKRRSKVIARQTPLNPVSKRRRAENRQRRAMLKAKYPEPENVMCIVPGCCNRADDGHEPLSRARGGSITDPDNLAPLCRDHHREITDFEPEWAYELGLLRHSWDQPEATLGESRQ